MSTTSRTMVAVAFLKVVKAGEFGEAPQDISCKNTACVSHPKNMQHEVEAFFERCRQGGL